MTDREKLLELIAIGGFFSRSADAEKCADYLIANGVAPVVHGRWIELPSMAPEYQCSECEQSYEWWEPSEAHYCPSCGAKMDGGVSDG